MESIPLPRRRSYARRRGGSIDAAAALFIFVRFSIRVIAGKRRVYERLMGERPIHGFTERCDLQGRSKSEANSVVISPDDTDIRVVTTEFRTPKVDIALKATDLPPICIILASDHPEPAMTSLVPI